MKRFIYCLEFKDGSFYIGQTKNVKIRLGGHRFKMQEDFEYLVIDECDGQNVLLIECMWIQLFKSWGLSVRNKNPFQNVDTTKTPTWINGRKPIADKAVRFIIYPRQSWLKKVGSAKAKELAERAIEKEASKNK